MKDPAYQREYQRSTAARIFAPPREPSTRTNKRFLASMIRNADSHNQRRSASGFKGEKERPQQRTSRWDLAPGSTRKECIAIMTIQKMRQYHLEIVLDRLAMLKKDRQSLNRDHRLKYVYGT